MRCNLMENLYKAMQAIHDEQLTPRDYGTGDLLYHAELSLLDVIARNPDKSAVQLATQLGITKGALTQTAQKLVEKGLIEQYNPPKNRKTKHHRLTAAGILAISGHAQYHAEANARMQAYLCGRSAQDKQVIADFFETLLSCMPICLYDCDKDNCGCIAPSIEGGTTNAGA